jgi:hypothetical protein
VISVMNSAYGKPGRDTLPFDLAYLRWPIEYNLHEIASAEDKVTEKRRLAKILKDAIRTSLATVPVEPIAVPTQFPAMQAKDGPARFRSPGEPIGIQDEFYDDDVKDIYFASGPAMWLRLMPHIDTGRTVPLNQIKELSTKSTNLFPLFHTAGGYSYVRGADGEGVYRAVSREGKPQAVRVTVPSVAFAFETGEIWSVDMAMYGYDKEHIFYGQIAEAYKNALTRYSQFLRDLGFSPPFRWEAGMIGAYKRKLQYEPPPGKHWVAGHPGRVCLNDVIQADGEDDGTHRAEEVLAPFFDKIFTKCGTERPDYLRK